MLVELNVEGERESSPRHPCPVRESIWPEEKGPVRPRAARVQLSVSPTGIRERENGDGATVALQLRPVR